MDLTTIGLLLIAAGWIVQALKVCHGSKEMDPHFLGLYSLGVLLLVIDSFNTSAGLAIVNLIALTSALYIYFKGCGCCASGTCCTPPKPAKKAVAKKRKKRKKKAMNKI